MGRELTSISGRLWGASTRRDFPRHFIAPSPQPYDAGRTAPISHKEIETGLETGCEWPRATQLISAKSV